MFRYVAVYRQMTAKEAVLEQKDWPLPHNFRIEKGDWEMDKEGISLNHYGQGYKCLLSSTLFLIFICIL